jgi:hypothetical protein
MGQIVQELEGQNNPSAVVLEGLGLELIGYLVEGGSRSESRHIPDWLLRTKEMIEDCAGDDLSISDLAATASVHPVYLAVPSGNILDTLRGNICGVIDCFAFSACWRIPTCR